MSEREEGFYWVLLRGEWTTANYDGGDIWTFPGDDRFHYTDSGYISKCTIGPRIESPDEIIAKWSKEPGYITMSDPL